MISENKLDLLISSLKEWVENSLQDAIAGIARIDQLENRLDSLTSDDYRTETLVRNLQEAITQENSTFNESITEIHNEFRNNEKSIRSISESLDELRRIASDIDNLSVKCEDFNNHKEEYLKSIEGIVSSIDNLGISLLESENKVKDEFLSESTRRKELKEEVESKFQNIEDSFGILTEAVDIISHHVTSVNKSISEYRKNATESDLKLKDDIDVVISELVLLSEGNASLKEYVESQYIELKKYVNSAHSLKVDANRFDRFVENVDEKIDNVITEFKSELLNSSLDNTQVSRDVSRLFSFADNVKSKITSIEDDVNELKSREPVKGLDGKNGLNWEFKTHPMAKGTLFFKREDHDEWQSVNLMPKIIMDTVYGSSGSGVGVAEARKIAAKEVDNARITVTRMGEVVEEKLSVLEVEGAGVAVTNPSPGVVRLTVMNGGGSGSAETTFIGNVSTPILTYRAIGTVLTDINGEFTFDFGLTGITTVYDVDVKAYLLDDVGLEPQERIVDCYVSNIGAGVVSGAAYFNRRVGGTVGENEFCRIPADAGVEVIVTVEGAI